MNAMWDGMGVERATPSISVEVGLPGPHLFAPWNALAGRADANVFMHPAALMAAAETAWSKIHVLVAHDLSADVPQIVGFWALRERRRPLVPAFLETLPYDYAFTSGAMIEPGRTLEVFAAFFEAIRRHPSLPKTVGLRSYEAGPEGYEAMLRSLAGSARHGELLRVERAFAVACPTAKRSGSARKKLRQIARLGAVEFVNERTPSAARRAFETFLALEAASWKGREGTALLCDSRHARFARRLFGDLADDGMASVAVLHVAGEAVAAQVMLYSGRRAYAWKTAYRSSHARFSPGLLLMDRVTLDLLASGFSTIDSCSAPGGFMGQLPLWAERRQMVDALIDLGDRGPFAFASLLAAHRAHGTAARVRDRARAVVRGVRTRWRDDAADGGLQARANGTATP